MAVNEWQTLLKKYTGWRLVLNVVFGVVFFLPVLIRLVIMMGMLPGTTAKELQKLQDMLQYDVSLWDLLMFGFLGTDSLIGWLSVGLTLAMLVYNVMLLVITWRVARLRRQSGHPAKAEYHWMYRVHMPWMYVLVSLSIGYTILRVYDAVSVRTILERV